jgi:hypothetical protein
MMPCDFSQTLKEIVALIIYVINPSYILVYYTYFIKLATSYTYKAQYPGILLVYYAYNNDVYNIPWS